MNVSTEKLRLLVCAPKDRIDSAVHYAPYYTAELLISLAAEVIELREAVSAEGEIGPCKFPVCNDRLAQEKFQTDRMRDAYNHTLTLLGLDINTLGYKIYERAKAISEIYNAAVNWRDAWLDKSAVNGVAAQKLFAVVDKHTERSTIFNLL